MIGDKKSKTSTDRRRATVWWIIAAFLLPIITVGLTLYWGYPISIQVVAYYLTINYSAFALYYLDKRRAVESGWRIPELTLHKISLLGGFVGARIGQVVNRHKVSKVSFLTVYWFTVVVHLVLIGWFIYERK